LSVFCIIIVKSHNYCCFTVYYRFVLELAEAEDGIIVSNDQYRDLMYEKAAWRKLIEERF
jgi:hypothetical protein